MTDTRHEHPAAGSLLSGIALFASLDKRDLSRLAKSTAEIDAPPGTVLFFRGDPCTGLYAVVSGRVKLAVPAEDRGEKVLALISPGQVFGESAMFLEQPYMLSAETLGPATLLHVLREALLACMQRDAEFARAIVRMLSLHVRELIAHIESSTTYSGTERVLDFLIGELPGEKTQGEVTIALPAKKRIIASRLDLTHEHFSRILHELSAAGLLIVQGSKVTIPDVGKLVAFRRASRISKATAAPSATAAARPLQT